MRQRLEDLITQSVNRKDFWIKFTIKSNLREIAELGVYKGDFAMDLLKECPLITKYYMIDPWRNLLEWNKPANQNNAVFDSFYKETLEKTNFAKEKIKILKGKTTEVISQIENNSLDFAYIDGDHTLKGISIDLINVWDKVKKNGFIGGDDFCNSIWEHQIDFEPTFIFPFAIYFAEAVNTKIYGLPYNQFLITKEQKGFEFIDLTNGDYDNHTVLQQINKKINLKTVLIKKFPNLYKIFKG